MNKYLILENGMTFKGEGFGAPGDVTAEIVFTTAMTGYLETLTDKSYAGQAIVQTFPLIGNYGIIPEDVESNMIGTSAYIVREWCDHPSNFRSTRDLDTYLKSRGIVGLCKIDTRALTRVLREHGTMNGIITDNPSKVDLSLVKSYKCENPVSHVSTKEMYVEGTGSHKVALLDFGMKENICRCLTDRDCTVYVFPSNSTVDEILSVNPDGIFLSNGPGDPQDNVEIIETIKKLLTYNYPMMGICLGHQLLALAHGFNTSKLKYGHRGANQPVRYLETGRTFISSQNHGYAVVNDSIDKAIAEPLFENVNDGTNEGLKYLNKPVFSVQFHPEACAGPKDTSFLFDQFIDYLNK
ncbi:MAG: carbamoyl phosphate synthase small subunit [Lachnospiraceae bacterium]|nr:carbamoyl phosphate synthase small subunit [Lachnospiraceae bacterium]